VVERILSEVPGKPDQSSVAFIFTNKIRQKTSWFCTFVLSEHIGHKVEVGKIIQKRQGNHEG